MKITKDYPGLKETDYSFELDGDLVSEEEIEIDLGQKWLVVKGSITAKKFIKNSGSGIKAGEGIKAGLSIVCKLILSAKYLVFAGVCTWRETVEDDQMIICGRLNARIGCGIVRETEITEEETVSITLPKSKAAALGLLPEGK